MLNLRGRIEITMEASNHRNSESEETLNEKYLRLEKECDSSEVRNILNLIMEEKIRCQQLDLSNEEKMESWLNANNDILLSADTANFSELEKAYMETAYAYIVKEHDFTKRSKSIF